MYRRPDLSTFLEFAAQFDDSVPDRENLAAEVFEGCASVGIVGGGYQFAAGADSVVDPVQAAFQDGEDKPGLPLVTAAMPMEHARQLGADLHEIGYEPLRRADLVITAAYQIEATYRDLASPRLQRMAFGEPILIVLILVVVLIA